MYKVASGCCHRRYSAIGIEEKKLSKKRVQVTGPCTRSVAL